MPAPVDFASVVTGTTANQIPYTRSSGDAGWTSLGGRLVGPPAVVMAKNGRTYYVGVDPDEQATTAAGGHRHGRKARPPNICFSVTVSDDST